MQNLLLFIIPSGEERLNQLYMQLNLVNLTYLNWIILFFTFRFKHVQIRSNAESAAFYVAGEVERQKTNQNLFSLLDTQLNVVNWEFWLHSKFMFQEVVPKMH